MRKKTFTLVEMLCVVAIIAILCGIIFGAYNVIQDRNAEIKTKATLKKIQIALAKCKGEFGYYPQDIIFKENPNSPDYKKNSDLSLPVMIFAPSESSKMALDNDGNVKDSYMNDSYFVTFYKACDFLSLDIGAVSIDGHTYHCILDGWKNPLQYRSNGKSYVLYSMGPDGSAELDDNAEIDVELESGEHANLDNIYLN